MNLITMVHVMGIKESVEAKLHCRNSAGFPGPHSCHSEFRHQNHPCLKPYNMPGWPGYNVTQCANNVIQTLPALIYLILQKDEGVLATTKNLERSLHTRTGMQVSLTWKHMILVALLVPWRLTSLHFHCLKVKIAQLFPSDPCDHHNLKISD